MANQGMSWKLEEQKSIGKIWICTCCGLSGRFVIFPFFFDNLEKYLPKKAVYMVSE